MSEKEKEVIQLLRKGVNTEEEIIKAMALAKSLDKYNNRKKKGEQNETK